MRHQVLKWVLTSSMCAAATCATAAGTDRHAWVDTWAATPDIAGPVLNAQTVRQIVRTSVAGSQVRIRLSNLFGNVPVTLGPVHVALSAEAADTVPGSDHVLLFNGKPTVTIPKGESALSDPVKMDVKALQQLAVSIYVPADTQYHPATIHNAALATSYITESGDATADVHFPREEVSGNRFFLTDLEVTGPSAKHTLVTFGDSITDGVGSNENKNERWPDDLAARLQADAKLSSIGVANAGIGGNRILHDNFGPSALTRFDRDALDKPGVRWIILLEGINDIGRGFYPPTEPVTAEALIAADKQIIARAHAHGILVYGATLTPYKGAHYFMPEGEQVREAVNQWIKTSGAFDGVVDFAPSVADKSDPTTFDTNYNLTDKLHPNDAGYQAMANAIDLGLLK